MADVFDQKTRSAVMQKVKSSGNKNTELRLISFFREHHVTGWRRNYDVKGHPDYVFPKERIAIFVDGCFWHGHECRNITPSDNAEYWRQKRERNMKHDLEVTRMFTDRGWTVIRIWECELKKKNEIVLLEKLSGIVH